jgi:hypothetical protein
VFIGLAAVYVSSSSPPGVSFAGKALGFADLGTAGWLLLRQGAGPGLNAPCPTAPIRNGERLIAERCCGG